MIEKEALMKQIRLNVFETNSSSTHSISFSGRNNECYNNIEVDAYDNKVHVCLGEFGWEIDSHTDSATKLQYLITYICQQNGLTTWYGGNFEDNLKELQELEDFQNVEECVRYELNCDGIEIDSLEGYIDHQSVYGDNLREYFDYEGVDNIHQFIFGNVIVHTDNDNH